MREVTGQKEKAATAHGEVEYETVTCASCENEVPKQKAKKFVIGDVTDHTDWVHRGVIEYEFSRTDVQTGWACEFCREKSIIAFPKMPSMGYGVFLPALLMLAFLIGVMVA